MKIEVHMVEVNVAGKASVWRSAVTVDANDSQQAVDTVIELIGTDEWRESEKLGKRKPIVVLHGSGEWSYDKLLAGPPEREGTSAVFQEPGRTVVVVAYAPIVSAYTEYDTEDVEAEWDEFQADASEMDDNDVHG